MALAKPSHKQHEHFLKKNEAASNAVHSMPDADWNELQHEVARYIASMTAEMGKMARSAKFDLLVYFLDMAQVEANALAEHTDG